MIGDTYDSNDEDLVERCPVCAEPIDFCQGHGEIGDPEGFAILVAHDDGQHGDCHPDGCEVAGVHRDQRLRVLNDVWTTGSGRQVPCAVTGYSAIPGYLTILVDGYEDAPGRREMAVPGYQVERP